MLAILGAKFLEPCASTEGCYKNARAEKWPALDNCLGMLTYDHFIEEDIWYADFQRTVYDFHKRLQACVNKARGEFEYFI